MRPASFDIPDHAAWLERHVARLRASYRRLTGRELIAADTSAKEAPAVLDAAPYAVVSHGSEAEPIFNYANRCALELFAMDWARFTRTLSRDSAAPAEQGARAQLLERVARDGYADGYRGVRIAADGRRFLIEDTTVWNVADEDGRPAGQAARIGRWRFL